MKILVLGHTGMAGHMITAYLRSQNHTVTTAGRRPNSQTNTYLDVLDMATVDNLVNPLSENTDFVINCIGLLVKNSLDRPDSAALINSWFPQYLAHKLSTRNTRLIHISTDCVFDGRSGQYLETDATNEQNFYGRSKSLGEVQNHKDITFRTSIIGPELANFTGLLDWVRLRSDSVINGWTNALWNGMTTLQLAKCVNDYMMSSHRFSGIYHLVDNSLKISKYHLCHLINDVYDCRKTVMPTRLDHAVDKTLVDTRLCRNWGIPDYRTQLQELRDFDPLAHVTPAAP